MPVLVCRDRRTQFVTHCPVPFKGVCGAATSALRAFLLYLGYSSFLLRSDGESALSALKAEIKRTTPSLAVQVEVSSSTNGNGSAEQAVQFCHGMVRTLLAAIRLESGLTIDTNHACIPWLVQWSGFLTNVANRSRDGRTPFERLRRRKVSVPIFRFGARVFVKLPAKAKLAERWAAGCYAGISRDSMQHIILLPDSTTVVSRNVKADPTVLTQ